MTFVGTAVFQGLFNGLLISSVEILLQRWFHCMLAKSSRLLPQGRRHARSHRG